MATSLGGVAIADPFDFQASLEFLASMQRSANGTVLLDYFSTTPKSKIKLQWRMLTITERNTLYNQITGAISTSRVLALPDGRSFTVLTDVDNPMTEILVRDAFGYKYNMTAAFVEV